MVLCLEEIASPENTIPSRSQASINSRKIVRAFYKYPHQGLLRIMKKTIMTMIGWNGDGNEERRFLMPARSIQHYGCWHGTQE